MAMKAISIALALGIGLMVLTVIVLRFALFIMEMVDPLSSNLAS